MPSSPAVRGSALRGRDAELQVVADALTQTRTGHGAIILVEGRGGFGKTRFLAEVAAMGRRAGIRVGSGAIDSANRLLPLGALFAAMFEGDQPLLDRDALRDLHSLPEQRYWMLDELAELLEQAALDGPLMLCHDDMQWADGACLAGVRALPARLITLPIVWVFAYRADSAPVDVRHELTRLERLGARHVEMGALDEAAIEQVIADTVGGVPEPALLEVAERSPGSPFLLVELLLGLLEEGLIQTESGCARLVEARLPARVRDSMRDRLSRMTPLARRVAAVASVLDFKVSFERLAAMLDLSPADLLSPVDELLAADLFVEAGGDLIFRHDLIREAVAGTLPGTAREALQRQAAHVLLASGAPPLEVAGMLLASARPGDRTAIAALQDTARQLGPIDPATASELSLKALSLTAREDPNRIELVRESAMLLHDAGRQDEAKALLDDALRDGLTPDEQAEIRLTIAAMYRLSPTVRVEAGLSALSEPGVSVVTQARHRGRLVINLAAAGQVAEAREMADQAGRAVESTGDPVARADLAVGNLALDQLANRYTRLLAAKHATEGLVARDGERSAILAAEVFAGIALASLDRLDEALDLAAAGLASAQRDHQAWMVQRWQVLQGHFLLQAGRLNDSIAALEGLFADTDPVAVLTIANAAGLLALGRAAIHTGDEALMRRSEVAARATLAAGTPDVRRHAAWLLALLRMARGDAVAARAELAALGEDAAPTPLPMLLHVAADEAQLLRLALTVGDDGLADQATVAAQRRLDLNPDVPSIAATAAQVRGLRADDLEQLTQAVELFAASARPLAHASALEDLALGVVRRSDSRGAAKPLEEALALYDHAGATWDAGRVRNHMRRLGLRRRRASRASAANGWAGLTPSEVEVVNLSAQGLTNREVAGRLFLSPHTVSMHLRHVYAKLGISSRAELARIALINESVDRSTTGA
jgi:DNA-binding CsgD family transcriptional regulator